MTAFVVEAAGALSASELPDAGSEAVRNALGEGEEDEEEEVRYFGFDFDLDFFDFDLGFDEVPPPA